MKKFKLKKFLQRRKLSEPYNFRLTEIIVPTEKDKEKLLEAIRYIHYMQKLETGFPVVNTIAHIYLNEDLIRVQSDPADVEVKE
jgi:hypothetical protein